MRSVRNKIIKWHGKLICWWKKLIDLGKNQITIWLNENPCWTRAITSIYRFAIRPILVGVKGTGKWGIGWLKNHDVWKLIILLIFAVSVFVLLFWSSKEQETVRNLLLLVAGIVGWYFLNRRTKAAEQEAKTAEQGLTVARLTRATEQIANNNPSIRLGGIIGFERIVETHEEEREQIVQILSARIHELAPRKDEEKTKKRSERLDIETAVRSLSNIAKPLKNKKASLCELLDINFSRLRFYDVDLSYFDFTGTNFNRTIVTRTNFNQAYLRNTEFNRSYLDNASFSRARLGNANFSGARLNAANFSRARLGNANFSGARLNAANFSGARLDDANFSGARLANVNFSSARLSRANLIDTYFRDVNFSDTLLSGANLSDAYLRNANLSNAYLRNANLSNADFEGATGLTQQQIDEAFYWKGHPPRNLPNGLQPPKERNDDDDLSF